LNSQRAQYCIDQRLLLITHLDRRKPEMYLQSITLKRTPWAIATLDDARAYVEFHTGTHQRAAPHWVTAIADLNSAIAARGDSALAATSRTSIHRALAADGVAD
jgi:hypothetical protein